MGKVQACRHGSQPLVTRPQPGHAGERRGGEQMHVEPAYATARQRMPLDADNCPMSSAALIASFETQASWCERLGSPFTAGLMRYLAGELRRSGTFADTLPAWPRDAMADLVGLRVAGALHALVLADPDSALAHVYPPHTSQLDAARAGPLVLDALASHPEHLAQYLQSTPQTNEVGRAAVLLGGLSIVARRTGLPLAVREIGASAGLNLLWDRFRYTLGAQQWGDTASPVHIASDWRGTPPPLLARIAVHSRAACDRMPITLASVDESRRLMSYVWPDQTERLSRLRAAIALAQGAGVQVEAADAAPWVEAQLGKRPEGAALVLMHSIVWQYLDTSTRERISCALDAAGSQATRSRPLAWLRLEHHDADAPAELRLTLWPGGPLERLATAHSHGTWVHWRAE